MTSYPRRGLPIEKIKQKRTSMLSGLNHSRTCQCQRYICISPVSTRRCLEEIKQNNRLNITILIIFLVDNFISNWIWILLACYFYFHKIFVSKVFRMWRITKDFQLLYFLHAVACRALAPVSNWQAHRLTGSQKFKPLHANYIPIGWYNPYYSGTFLKILDSFSFAKLRY